MPLVVEPKQWKLRTRMINTHAISILSDSFYAREGVDLDRATLAGWVAGFVSLDSLPSRCSRLTAFG
jgi:hypothetical protein